LKPLVIIPARGGSKGVPGKNIRPLNGKPLIHYTIEAAREVFPAGQILVSTDDPAIRTVAEQTGLKVPFLRPAELATDTAGSQEVLLHALGYAEAAGYTADTVVLLQPTSPFRTATHIRAALQLYRDELEMVVGVKETRSNPYYVLFEENAEGYLEKSKKSNFTRRQDCPKVWEINGALYIIRVAALRNGPIGSFERVLKYEMDEWSSHDIDTPFDWDMAELMIKKLPA
jgi:N-acylneuraminate cytidylyltransferase